MSKKLLLSLTAIIAFGFITKAQNVNIPDANFKAYLVGNSSINTNGDTEIQTSEASAFTGQINCAFLSISDLTGIEAFTSVTDLRCNNNSLTSLDVTQNSGLMQLNCYDNTITSLNLSQNNNLTILNCYRNNISSLNLNTSLTLLNCQLNSLLSLDLTQNTNLNEIYCQGNLLTSLDLSQNTSLTAIFCSDNSLSILNVANGNNSSIFNGSFIATNNPNLTCIQVDNASATGWTNIDAIASFSNNCAYPCIVNIPDANFKAYLVGSASINTNGNAEIECSEASAYTSHMNIPNLSISDLTGIEAFTNITRLSCNYNSITTLDLSSNINLTNLNCGNNNLTSLNITSNTSLEILNCNYNNLSSLDLSSNINLETISCGNNLLTSLTIPSNNLTSLLCINNSITNLDVSACTNLKFLSARQNALSSLDVTSCPKLESLGINFNNISNIDLSNNDSLLTLTCSNNVLTSLDVSNNIKLTNIKCNYNSIANLDVSQNTLLEELYCNNTSLTSLDVSSNNNLEILDFFANTISSINLVNNTALRSLSCSSVSLTSLDVSSNTNLEYLYCYYNSLTNLNVANGNNTNMVTFNAIGNPNLTCIEVDDTTYSNANWTDIDAASSFSTNCSAPCTVNIPDANFKAYLVGNTSINTNGNAEIECTEASAFSGTINCSNQSISDLTGIEAFTALTVLYCYTNSITSLDISSNIDLTELYCNTNAINSLDVSNNTSLTLLDCYSNPINNLDVSNNTSLTRLACSANSLTSLDVSNNANLTELICLNNSLTNLNVANANNTNMITFNATNNPNLMCIQVDDVAYSTTNWTDIDAPASFSTNCGVVSPILVSSITVQGQGGVSSITTMGGSLQMEANVLPMNADDASYTWSVTNGTGAATIDANGLLTASSDGTVDVVATANDASGTMGTKTITISNQSVGIQDMAFENVSIYPNPTSGILNLDIKEELSSIKIMDISGRTIQAYNPENTQVDISSFTTGIYFLEIANAEKKSIVKIIKK